MIKEVSNPNLPKRFFVAFGDNIEKEIKEFFGEGKCDLNSISGNVTSYVKDGANEFCVLLIVPKGYEVFLSTEKFIGKISALIAMDFLYILGNNNHFSPEYMGLFNSYYNECYDIITKLSESLIKVKE